VQVKLVVDQIKIVAVLRIRTYGSSLLERNSTRSRKASKRLERPAGENLSPTMMT
jgi:hypothetical protein